MYLRSSLCGLTIYIYNIYIILFFKYKYKIYINTCSYGKGKGLNPLHPIRFSFPSLRVALNTLKKDLSLCEIKQKQNTTALPVTSFPQNCALWGLRSGFPNFLACWGATGERSCFFCMAAAHHCRGHREELWSETTYRGHKKNRPLVYKGLKKSHISWYKMSEELNLS